MKSPMLALAGSSLAQVPADESTKSDTTFINEFLYPRVVVCYDPSDNDSEFHPEDALRNRASALELHLRLRCDGAVVCSHNGPIKPTNPTMTEVIDLVLRHQGQKTTVYGDGLQFFFMLEIFNDPSPEKVRKVIDKVFEEMKRYAPHLSTAVGPQDSPRGITFVITGQSDEFYQQLKHHGPELNRLCIVENVDYGQSIKNLSANRPAFQWALYQFDQHRGLVNTQHGAGLPPPKDQSLFNVRVWNEDAPDHLRLTLASGVDGMNARPGNIKLLHDIIRHQHPRGFSPSLAAFGSRCLLAWRGESSNNLYVALGSATPLAFARQLNLTYFLSGQPQAIAPAAALTNDQSLFVVYEGTGDQKLWYVSGRLNDADRFLTFDGGQRLLTSGNSRRGRNPAVAVAPDGRLIVVYEGTDDQRIWYVSGFLDSQGEFVGNEFELTDGNTRRGYTPSIAFDSKGQVVVAYRGTDDQKLFYVSGSVNGQGQIIGQEFSLTEGNTRRGSSPSVAIAPDNDRVVIAYEGTDDQRLFYVSGFRDSTGRIVGSEHRLTEGQTRRGTHPTAVFGNFGKQFTILYQGTGDDKFWFVEGAFDGNGQLVGQEQLLDMGFELN
jgi:hypothetical protein